MAAFPRPLARLGHRLVDPVVAHLGDRIVEDVNVQVADRVKALSAELQGSLRDEMLQVARMLRDQGDADDELAETLGRTLARLSAEVESLSAAVAELESRGARSTPP